MKRLIATIGLLVMLPFAAIADDMNTADLNCLVIGARMMASTDEHVKNSGMIVSMYFIGRLDGRAPTQNIENGLYQQIMNMSPAALKTEAKRCSDLLASRGKEITEMGQHLAARGQQKQ